MIPTTARDILPHYAEYNAIRQISIYHDNHDNHDNHDVIRISKSCEA